MAKHVYTNDEVHALVKEENVRFLRVTFSDLFGTMKSVDLPIIQLDKLLANKVMFDGSSIDGFVRIEESDMYLYPDMSTWLVFPWGAEHGKVAQVICSVHLTDGTPFAGDPRNNLKRVIKEMNDAGFSAFNIGPEPEFFLFETDENGNTTTKDIVLALESMGYNVEAAHHEVAPGQHEVDFKYSDALEAADNIQIFKLVVKTIAKKYGFHATFMPKPLAGINGNGMHMNMSLFKEEGGKVVNSFYDEQDKVQLSQTAYQFLAGVMDHARSVTAVCNPIVNSYKRLVPGYEAPVYVAWSASNRSPMVRLELRSVDPSANPYLAIAAILAAGLDGLKRGLKPADSVDENIYAMTEAERQAKGIHDLPDTLHNALKSLAQDDVIKAALGDHLYRSFNEAKSLEYEGYRQSVSKWEQDKYMSEY